VRPVCRCDRDRTRFGKKPSSAGTRVSATSTAITTAPAAASPIFASDGIPTTSRPASAITTVVPAKTTAEPAVPTARPAAVSASSCLLRSSWYRETTNIA
jgi:hypothetical protein